MNWFLVLLLCLGFAASPLACAPLASTNASREDGPYVLWEGQEARVLRVSQGRAEESRLREPWVLSLANDAKITLAPASPQLAQAQWPMPEKIAALSDIHGNLTGARKLLTANGVVDARGNWSFGAGHLVVVGDTMDRGPQVTEALWFFHRLETQAEKAGGHVHLLLGNHEWLVIQGTSESLNPKYEAVRKILGLDQKTLLGPKMEVGRWLRSRATLLKLGSTLFLHGGVSAELVRAKQDLDQINTVIRSSLDSPPDTPSLATHDDGPLWYRGLIQGSASVAEVNAALAAFGVERIVMGHTTLPVITSFYAGRIIGVDAGLKENRGELLIMEKGQVWRGLADGTRHPLDIPSILRVKSPGSVALRSSRTASRRPPTRCSTEAKMVSRIR